MSLRQLSVAAIACVVVAGFGATSEAQVSRVFVSVTGNDANVCSNVETPCRTLAGGIGQVDAQGEVIVIDSGSYAGGSITKSVKINVAAGVVAFSGLPIVVDPGMGGTVVLRGLTLKAATAGHAVGVTQLSGTLFVENTVVDGWNLGLRSQGAAQHLFVKGSVFRNNASSGLEVPFGSTTKVTVDDSFFERNVSGVTMAGGTGRVTNSVLTANNYGAATAQPVNEMTFQRCEVTHNLIGLFASLGSTMRVSGSTLTRNSSGLVNDLNGATVESFGNNVIRGNTSDTLGTITPVSLQ